MTFKEASQFIMPFGQHKSKTLDAIATSDDGLRYLEWLYDQRRSDGFNAQVDDALDTYINDPSIQKELRELVR